MSTKLTTNVDQRRLRTTKFPPEFNTKVDIRKVNMLIMNKWMRDELTAVLQGEDDVVEELVLNIMNGSNFVRAACLPVNKEHKTLTAC